MTHIEQFVSHIETALTDRTVLEISDGTSAFSTAAAISAACVYCAVPTPFSAPVDVDMPENLHVCRMQDMRLRLADGFFDTIVLCDTIIPFVDRLSALLDEAIRLLGPNGVICIFASRTIERTAVTDILLPLCDSKQLTYRLSVDARFICVKLRSRKENRTYDRS